MTDDIVTRLREQVDCSQQLMCYAPRRRTDRLSHEAADEIERLRERRDDWCAAMTENHDLWRENERLRAALDEACDECERMRAALFRIVENEDQYSMVWAAETAHAALKDKK